eukprot:1093380-Pyramimonas_sp.AAC.1
MSLTCAAAGAVAAGVPALLAVSAINGMGASTAGAVASVACPALADDAGCPAGVVAGAAALFIIIAVARLSSSRRSLSSLAPRSISPWRPSTF